MNKKIKVFLNSNDSELKEFGLLLAVVVPLLFGVIFPWLFNGSRHYTPWLIGWGIAGIAAVVPRVLKIIYVPWMLMADFLNTINHWIVLSVLFYLIITPIAIGMRWFAKRDTMERKYNKNILSFKKYNNDNKHLSFKLPY